MDSFFKSENLNQLCIKSPTLRSLLQMRSDITMKPINKNSELPASGTLPQRKKRAKVDASSVRRSSRIQHIAQDPELEANVQDIEVGKSKKDEELPVHEGPESPQSASKAIGKSPRKRMDSRYKTMFIGSQKKLQALMEENKQLRKQLDHVVGKIGVYSECMAIISSMTKTTEAAVNLSAKVLSGATSFNVDAEAERMAAAQDSTDI